MSKKKYIVILILALLGMLCMAGASAWIIANPFTVKPSWHDSKPKFYVNKTVELCHDDPHSLGDIKESLVFRNEKGEDITAEVGTINIADFTDGKKSFSNADATTVDMGTTYLFELDLRDPPAEYAFGGTYASYDEAEKQFTGIEKGALKDTTLLFKYKTVRLNDEFYTVEDALDRMPETISEESKESIAIVEYDTAFAHPEVAKAAGYLDASGAPQRNYYNVRGTLLVPYAETAVGFISTGLMDSRAVENVINGEVIPGEEGEPSKEIPGVDEAIVRANAKTFTQDYNKPEPPAPYERKPYVTLTLLQGLNLSVTGRLVVNAVISSSNGNTSRVNGDYYGELSLEEGASLALESGSTFDCMGFTRGAGELVAKDGANVFEPFNMSGWKGGGETLTVYGAGVFPLAQYTVASLVAKTVFQKGCVYSLRAFVAGSMGDVTYACAEVKFVSAKSSQDEVSFLEIDKGTVTKEVNETNGKLHFIADGDIRVNNLGLNAMGINVNTAGMDVPVPGHLEMVINSGTTTIPEDVSLKMLPGAHVRIEKGATLVIDGKALSYGAKNGEEDAEGNVQQGNFQDGALSYPLSRLTQVYRVKPDLGYTATTPARVVVNGKLIVNKSATVAAEIESEGGGVADIDKEAKLSCIQEDIVNPDGSTIKGDRIAEYGKDGAYKVALTSKWWHGDGETDDVMVGQWKYIDNQWIGPSSYTIRYHLNNGELAGEEDVDGVVTKEVTDDVWLGQMNVFTPAIPTRKYYYFEGWYRDADHSPDKRIEGDAEVKSGDTIDLYAKWSPILYTVYGRIMDGADFPLGTWTCEQETLPLNLAEKDGYDFFGWYLQETAVGEMITKVDLSTIDLISQGEQNGREIPLYLFGRYEEAGSTMKVEFVYSAPTEFETTEDNASKYPALKNVTEEGIPTSWTFEQAGMPATDLHGNDYDLKREYYFEGWFAEDGTTVIDPKALVDPSLDKDGDVTVTVTAKWTKKYRLSIKLESNHGGNSDGLGLAYILGFELIYAHHPEPISEHFENKREESDKTKDSREYLYWFMPDETFDLKFFYKKHSKSEHPSDPKEETYDTDNMQTMQGYNTDDNGGKITVTMSGNVSFVYSCESEVLRRQRSLKRDPEETEEIP